MMSPNLHTIICGSHQIVPFHNYNSSPHSPNQPHTRSSDTFHHDAGPRDGSQYVAAPTPHISPPYSNLPPLDTNTKRETGRTAQLGNIEAAKAVSDIVRTTLGPRSMLKMLLDPMGGIVMTNDGNAILREVDVAHPAAKSMIELSRAQDEEVGDGTTSVIILAGELLIAKKLARPIDIENKEDMRNLVQSSIGTKFSPRVGNLVSDLALDAVLTVVRTSASGQKEVDVKRYAKVEKIPGGELEDSRVLKGVMFNKDVTHSKMRRRIENPRVLLLDCPLEYKKGESQTNVELTNDQDWNTLLRLEEEYIENLCAQVVAMKPDVVITEKGVSDLAQHYFVKAGITAFRRLRKTDNNRVARATGATIVSRADEIQESDIGTKCGLFEVRKLGDEYFAFFEECKDPGACSILLRGGSKDVLNEIERNLQDAMQVARNVVFEPLLLPGGGATEMRLAHELKKRADEIEGVEQFPFRAVGEALEVIPRTLLQNCGADVVRVMTSLRAKQAETEESHGVDGVTGKVTPSEQLGVWEPFQVKTQSIKTAVEAALTADMNLPELLVLTAEAAVFQGDFDTASKSIEWFFSECQLKHQIVDALKLTAESDVTWLLRLQLVMVYAQVDANQLSNAAKTINDVVDVQMAPRLTDLAKADVSFKALYEEALRLQVHVGSFKDPECQKIVPNVKRLLPSTDKRSALLVKLQCVKSGNITSTLEAAYVEIFQESTGFAGLNAETPLEEAKTYMGSLEPRALEAIDAEVVVETGIHAAFNNVLPVAAACDVVLQRKGKNMPPKTRVLCQVLNAILLIAMPSTHTDGKLSSRQRESMLLSRRVEGTKAFERALLASKRQQDPQLVEGCVSTRGICRYLCCSLTCVTIDSSVFPSVVNHGRAGLIVAWLSCATLLGDSQTGGGVRFPCKANANVCKALALDYGTISRANDTSAMTVGILSAHEEWIIRPVDTHLLPIKQKLDLKLAVEESSSRSVEVLAMLEQVKEGKDPQQQRKPGAEAEFDENTSLQARKSKEIHAVKIEILEHLTKALKAATKIGWTFVLENTCIYLWNYHFHIFRMLVEMAPSSSSEDAFDPQWILPGCISAFEAVYAALEVAAGVDSDLLANVGLGLSSIYEKTGRLDKALAIADIFLKRKPVTSNNGGTMSVLHLKRFAELKSRVQIAQNAKDITPTDSTTAPLKIVAYLEAMEVTFKQMLLPAAQQPQLLEKAQGFYQKAITMWQTTASETFTSFMSNEPERGLEEEQQLMELYVEIWVRIGCGAFRLKNTKLAIDCAEEALLALKSSEDKKSKQMTQLLFYGLQGNVSTIVIRACEAIWNATISVINPSINLGSDESEDNFLDRVVDDLRKTLRYLDQVITSPEADLNFYGEMVLLTLAVCEKAYKWSDQFEICESVLRNFGPNSHQTPLPRDMMKEIQTTSAICGARIGKPISVPKSGGSSKSPDQLQQSLVQASILKKVAFSSWKDPPAQLKALSSAFTELDGQGEEQALVLVDIAEWLFTNQFPTQNADAYLECASSTLLNCQKQQLIASQAIISRKTTTDQSLPLRQNSNVVYSPLWFAEKQLRIFVMRATLSKTCIERSKHVRLARYEVVKAWENIVIMMNDVEFQATYERENPDSANRVDYDAWKQDKTPKHVTPVSERDWTNFFMDHDENAANRFYMPWTKVLQSNTVHITQPVLTLLCLEDLLAMLREDGLQYSSMIPSFCLYTVLFHAYIPQQTCIAQIWMEISQFDLMERLNLSNFSLPLHNALDMIQSNGDALIKELQEAQASTELPEGDFVSRKRHVFHSTHLDTREKAVKSIQLLLRFGFVRQAKTLLEVLRCSAESSSNSSNFLTSACEVLSSRVLEIEGQYERALSRAKVHWNFTLDICRFLEWTLRCCKLNPDLDESLSVLKNAEKQAARTVVAGMRRPVGHSSSYKDAAPSSSPEVGMVQLMARVIFKQAMILLKKAGVSKVSSILDHLQESRRTLEKTMRLLTHIDAHYQRSQLLIKYSAALQSFQQKYGDLELTSAGGKQFFQLPRAMTLITSAIDTLSDNPVLEIQHAIAQVLKLQCQRLTLFHGDDRQKADALRTHLWTRYTSSDARHATWVCCHGARAELAVAAADAAANQTAAQSQNQSQTPIQDEQETEEEEEEGVDEVRLEEMLTAHAAKVQKYQLIAFEKQCAELLRLCSNELVQVLGCRHPFDCAKNVLKHQSAEVIEVATALFEKCVSESNVQRLHLRRMKKLQKTHTSAEAHSLPFQLSQLYLTQQSESYKRMSVGTRVDAIVAALPSSIRVMCLHFSPDRCYLYAAFLGSTERRVAISRMEFTDTQAALLEQLQKRIQTWREKCAKETLAYEEAHGQDEMYEFTSAETSSVTMKAELKSNLTGNTLVLLLDRVFACLPMEALPVLQPADAIARDFSIQILHQRLMAMKKQPLRPNDIRVIVDPHKEDPGNSSGQTITSVVKQAAGGWKDAFEHGQIPSVTDWQQALLARRGGGLMYVGPNRVLGSYLPLQQVTGMNVALTCQAMILLDHAETQRVHVDKWATTFNGNRRLANGLLQNMTRGYYVGKALKKFGEATIAPSASTSSLPVATTNATDAAAATSSPTSGSDEITGGKFRLKNRFRYNPVCVAVPPVLGEHFDARQCGLNCGVTGDAVIAVDDAQAARALSIGVSATLTNGFLLNVLILTNNFNVECRYGAAVHFKIYPIIYALAFLVLRVSISVRGVPLPLHAHGQPSQLFGVLLRSLSSLQHAVGFWRWAPSVFASAHVTRCHFVRLWS
ncbi:GroEL-like equatorial domain [Phytophthora cactorum]|nr:GroEL-like equatorial domain [Phytophthora cactorum]